jgi:hypothetical protein
LVVGLGYFVVSGRTAFAESFFISRCSEATRNIPNVAKASPSFITQSFVPDFTIGAKHGEMVAQRVHGFGVQVGLPFQQDANVGNISRCKYPSYESWVSSNGVPEKLGLFRQSVLGYICVEPNAYVHYLARRFTFIGEFEANTKKQEIPTIRLFRKEVWKNNFFKNPRPLNIFQGLNVGISQAHTSLSRYRRFSSFLGLPDDCSEGEHDRPCSDSFRPCYEFVPPLRLIFAGLFIVASGLIVGYGRGWNIRLLCVTLALSCILLSGLLLLSGHRWYCEGKDSEQNQISQHRGEKTLAQSNVKVYREIGGGGYPKHQGRRRGVFKAGRKTSSVPSTAGASSPSISAMNG